MKLVVIGRGLAAMGLLWNVAKSAELSKNLDKIYWIGHNAVKTPTSNKDAHFCSAFSTALVARQGIERGVSPLGDLLYRSFYETLAFIDDHQPPGVTKLRRFHLDFGGDAQERLEKRFGALSALSFNCIPLGIGFEEEALSFHPEIFLTWFEEEIVGQLSQVELIEDFVISHDEKSVSTLAHGDIFFDKLALCNGALMADFPGLKEQWASIPKKAVGHYLHWDKVDIPISESFCLTWRGHNLIYRHEISESNDISTMVWGGSTYSDAIEAPRCKDLERDLEELLQTYPAFRFSGNRSIRTGMRSKAPRRRPVLELSEDGNQLLLNGYYKNGWTLCHTLGAEGARTLLR